MSNQIQQRMRFGNGRAVIEGGGEWPLRMAAGPCVSVEMTRSMSLS